MSRVATNGESALSKEDTFIQQVQVNVVGRVEGGSKQQVRLIYI